MTNKINKYISELLSKGKTKVESEEEIHLVINRIRKDGVIMDNINFSFENLTITHTEK